MASKLEEATDAAAQALERYDGQETTDVRPRRDGD